MGIEAVTEKGAEQLFDMAELYEFENPDDCHPELNVVTGNEGNC